MQIIKNKKLLIIICACAAVLLVLICWELTLIVQENSFKQQVKNLQEQIATGEEMVDRYKDDLEYRQTTDFIIQWAEEHSLLSPEQQSWIDQNLHNDDE